MDTNLNLSDTILAVTFKVPTPAAKVRSKKRRKLRFVRACIGLLACVFLAAGVSLSPPLTIPAVICLVLAAMLTAEINEIRANK